MKDTNSSRVPVQDRLGGLFERFGVSARMFHSGPLCGVSHFVSEPGVAFLHVMRRGEMAVTHRLQPDGPVQRIEVTEPSLLFYPRPLSHDLHNAPVDGADFTCATLRFDGGEEHPLARALPPVIVLPLAEVRELDHTLPLLFAEADHLRCGHTLLADRLFEVLLIQLLRWLLDHPERAGATAGLISGLSDPALARALTALHRDPGQAWSVDRLAAEAGLSRTAFASRFRQRMDATPADYLAGWRLAITRSRLLKGEALKQVAMDVGYGHASALSRAFSQRHGMSPREWVQAQRDASVTSPSA